MLDYLTLQSNTENPTFLSILVTVLFSFLLSTLIVFTYEKTSRETIRPDHFLQSLVLVSIVAATIMQAIGDSVARGLGILGALAIIRFRTNLRDPRNIVFMFASLATGIACGVYGFVIAITGTAGFCAAAFLLRLTPFSRSQNAVGILRFEWDSGQEVPEQLLKNHCSRYSLRRLRTLSIPGKENITEYEYQIRLLHDRNWPALVRELQALSYVRDIRLSFADSPEDV